MDWSVVVAIATVATALFTGYALMQRSLERPRPRWAAERDPVAKATRKGDGWLRIKVVNIGDGTAYDAHIEVVNGAAIVLTDDRTNAPRLDSGDALNIGVRVPAPPGTGPDPHGNMPRYDVSADMLGGTTIKVTWNHPPHRWRRRHRTWRVARLAP